MCLNELLHNEQITLMRYAAASEPAVLDAQRRKLSMFAHMLEAHPYPHRPYDLSGHALAVPRRGRRAQAIVEGAF